MSSMHIDGLKRFDISQAPALRLNP
jgi:hypothetical protein